MADLPEYKRQTGITPAGSSGSFQNAMQRVGESHLSLGSLGAEIAQTSADHQAKLAGIEAAKTPGRQLMPAFTQSDKAFVEAYRHEEYNSLLYQGQKYLNDSFHEASKNPNAKTLKSFEVNARKTLAGIGENSQVDLAPDLLRQLEHMYDGKYQQLSNAVQAKNKAYMAASFSRAYDASLDNIANFHLQGNHEAAKSAYEQSVKSIKNAAANGIINPHQAYEREKVARIRNQQAYYQYKGIQAQEEGRAEEFMQSMVQNEPEHLTPLEHMDILKSTQGMLNQRESYLKGQQTLDYLHAQRDLAAGTLTASSLIDYQEKLSPQDFARLELKIANQTQTQAKDTEIFGEMLGSLSDPAAMSKYSGKQMDTTFAKMVQQSEEYVSEQLGEPYKATLIDEAQIAQAVKRDIPSLSKKISASLEYGGAEDAATAARAYRMLRESNPAAIGSMDTNARAVADLFDQYSRNTSYSGEDSLKAARNDVYNVDENKKRERTEQLKQFKNDKGLLSHKDKANFIAKNLDAKHFWGADDKVPAGLNAVFDDLLQSMTLRVGDPKIAVNMAFDELRKVYKHTNTNNRKEIMAVPPESVLPNVGHFVENDKVRALKEIVEGNAAAQKNGGAFNKLSWPNAPDTSDLINKRLVDGDIKILVDGKPRKIVIVSDAITQLSKEGTPSWSFNYIDDRGIEIPLMDLRTKAGVARWYPKIEGIEAQQKAYEQQQLKKAMEIKENKKHPERNIFQYRDANVDETL